MVTKNNPHAVVVLPAISRGALSVSATCRWLSRGNISLLPRREEMLNHVLRYLCIDAPKLGYAALRYRGQGGCETGWIAAADPLYFQPRMRDVVARSFSSDQLNVHDVQSLFDSLQIALGDGSRLQFESIGLYGYLKLKEPIDTATISTVSLDGEVPDGFAPRGPSARSYQTLQSEVQMLLHQNAVNERREQAGQWPINALWLWGGGFYPDILKRELPPLFSEEPLFNGYWSSCGAEIMPWPGDFGTCIEEASGSFVVVLPERIGNSVETHIEILRQHLKRGNLKGMVLLFSDYLSVEIKRRNMVRVWRGISPLLEKRVSNE